LFVLAAEEFQGWDGAREEVVAGPENAIAVKEEDLPEVRRGTVRAGIV
jgi:hypothetical protein